MAKKIKNGGNNKPSRKGKKNFFSTLITLALSLPLSGSALGSGPRTQVADEELGQSDLPVVPVGSNSAPASAFPSPSLPALSLLLPGRRVERPDHAAPARARAVPPDEPLAPRRDLKAGPGFELKHPQEERHQRGVCEREPRAAVVGALLFFSFFFFRFR